jgi:hypothetical protein
MRGFAISPNAPTAAITTSYDVAKAIVLGQDSTKDDKSRDFPQSCLVDTIELRVIVTAGAPTTVSARLFYDIGCDEAASDEASGKPLLDALTTAAVKGTAIKLDRLFGNMPKAQTAVGKLYLVLKVDAGTITLTTARAHWRDLGLHG